MYPGDQPKRKHYNYASTMITHLIAIYIDNCYKMIFKNIIKDNCSLQDSSDFRYLAKFI